MLLNTLDVTINKISEKDNTGVFSFKPLPKGFGYTLGNTLRRVLLTSLDGAAITQVKFNGVSHEFTTMPGVKEDVIELTLNLKQVRARMNTDNPVVLRINKKGPGAITAADIEANSDIEIVNPQTHIATLNDAKTHFEAELVFEKGVGFLPVEDRETAKVGVILLDAVFSPVVSASYKVEQTRSGRAVDLDDLVLTVSTDGSVSPEEAITRSSAILRDFFSRFSKGVDEVVEVETVEEEENSSASSQSSSEYDDVSVDELPLPTRTINALKKHGIKSLQDLVNKSPEELADIKNLGEKSVEEIEKLLKKEGLLNK
jgi:DNA-directed RNA polymerase subunit alpha